MSYRSESAPITGGQQPGPRPRLFDEVRRKLRLKHYSLSTERVYLQWMRRFIVANDRRHPREMGGGEVERFLSRLATVDDVSASTQNQALSALLFLYRDVLGVELPWMENVVRAKRPRRLPVVLSQEETRQLLAQMDGRAWLIASLLYGTGMRLREALRLRVKDVDFARNEILVRDGKGGKDRRTMLPRALEGPLQREIERVRVLHARDLAEGFGDARLPHALAHKYPDAGRGFGWQFVFPSTRRARDPLDGRERRHHFDDGVLARDQVGVSSRGHGKAGVGAHAQALVRHAPGRVGLRHSNGAGIAGAQGRGNHADLHACAQPRWRGSVEPAGPGLTARRRRPAHAESPVDSTRARIVML